MIHQPAHSRPVTPLLHGIGCGCGSLGVGVLKPSSIIVRLVCACHVTQPPNLFQWKRFPMEPNFVNSKVARWQHVSANVTLSPCQYRAVDLVLVLILRVGGSGEDSSFSIRSVPCAFCLTLKHLNCYFLKYHAARTTIMVSRSSHE